MFTGLVKALGTVTALERRDDGATIAVSTPLAAFLDQGDSVLVNGVCLTALAPDGDGFRADLSGETLRRSSLGGLSRGDRVNLEPALQAQDRLGGHIVQGHVDGVARLAAAEREGEGVNLWVEASPEVLRYVVEKGSVAIDGVSLTVTTVNGSGFGVALIPETLARTNLGDAEPGRLVNLEVDVLAKYVEKLIAADQADTGSGSA